MVVQLLLVGCIGPTQGDVDRANNLTNDPVFGELGRQWEASGELSVIPAQDPPNNGGTGLISQAYVRPDPFVSEAEFTSAAQVLERTGWLGVTIDCDNMQVRGVKDDGHGPVYLTVVLSDQVPSGNIRASIRAASLAEESEEFRDVLDRPGDKSCLTT